MLKRPVARTALSAAVAVTLGVLFVFQANAASRTASVQSMMAVSSAPSGPAGDKQNNTASTDAIDASKFSDESFFSGAATFDPPETGTGANAHPANTQALPITKKPRVRRKWETQRESAT